MTEWRDVVGFEGKYQVSSDGRVRNARTMQELTLNRLTKCGYRKAALWKDGKSHEKRIHRLVAEAFIPKVEGKRTVNHVDGDKLNNAVSNLEWSDRKEQLQHAYDLGLKKPMKGSANSQSKLTPQQVEEIRRSYVPHSKEFGSVALGRKYGVSHRVILLVAKGRSYR